MKYSYSECERACCRENRGYTMIRKDKEALTSQMSTSSGKARKKMRPRGSMPSSWFTLPTDLQAMEVFFQDKPFLIVILIRFVFYSYSLLSYFSHGHMTLSNDLAKLPVTFLWFHLNLFSDLCERMNLVVSNRYNCRFYIKWNLKWSKMWFRLNKIKCKL